MELAKLAKPVGSGENSAKKDLLLALQEKSNSILNNVYTSVT